jgi:hypothetical protein
MPRRPSPERVAPPLREYSFAQCPSAKLAACCQYEYLRSSKLIRDAVARLRAGEKGSQARSVALLFGPDIFWAFAGNSWPRLPYLDALEAREMSPEPVPKPKRRNLANLVRPWPQAGERHVVVYIPRGQSLPRLKKAFGDYLSRDYPHLLAKEPLSPEWRIQGRGRGSLTEQTRVDLTSLSAWRLQKQFGYTVKEAILLMDGSASETEKRAFYRSIRRAQEKINALEKELRQKAKRVTL